MRKVLGAIVIATFFATTSFAFPPGVSRPLKQQTIETSDAASAAAVNKIEASVPKASSWSRPI